MNGVNGQQTSLPIIESGSDGSGEAIGAKVTSKALLRRLEEQGRRCALTGIELSPNTVSLDHIVPLDDGGVDDMANIQLVHETINGMKGTMSQDDFIHWCKLVASHCIAHH